MRRVNEITKDFRVNKDKKREVMKWLIMQFPGFTELDYEMAVAIGDINLFNNEAHELVEQDGRLHRIGIQYKYIFVQRVAEYFNNKRIGGTPKELVNHKLTREQINTAIKKKYDNGNL